MIKAAMAGQKQAKIGRGARGVAETLFEGATRGRSGACVCVFFSVHTFLRPKGSCWPQLFQAGSCRKQRAVTPGKRNW